MNIKSTTIDVEMLLDEQISQFDGPVGTGIVNPGDARELMDRQRSIQRQSSDLEGVAASRLIWGFYVPERKGESPMKRSVPLGFMSPNQVLVHIGFLETRPDKTEKDTKTGQARSKRQTSRMWLLGYELDVVNGRTVIAAGQGTSEYGRLISEVVPHCPLCASEGHGKQYIRKGQTPYGDEGAVCQNCGIQIPHFAGLVSCEHKREGRWPEVYAGGVINGHFEGDRFSPLSYRVRALFFRAADKSLRRDLFLPKPWWTSGNVPPQFNAEALKAYAVEAMLGTVNVPGAAAPVAGKVMAAAVEGDALVYYLAGSQGVHHQVRMPKSWLPIAEVGSDVLPDGAALALPSASADEGTDPAALLSSVLEQIGLLGGRRAEEGVLDGAVCMWDRTGAPQGELWFSQPDLLVNAAQVKVDLRGVDNDVLYVAERAGLNLGGKCHPKQLDVDAAHCRVNISEHPVFVESRQGVIDSDEQPAAHGRGAAGVVHTGGRRPKNEAKPLADLGTALDAALTGSTAGM